MRRQIVRMPLVAEASRIKRLLLDGIGDQGRSFAGHGKRCALVDGSDDTPRRGRINDPGSGVNRQGPVQDWQSRGKHVMGFAGRGNFQCSNCNARHAGAAAEIVAVPDQEKRRRTVIAECKPGPGGDLRRNACGLPAGEGNRTGFWRGRPHDSGLRVDRVFVLDQSRFSHCLHVFFFGGVIFLV